MSNADVVYYNLTIGNNDPSQAGVLDYNSIPATIDAYNNIPIINNPDDYYASIIRFTIPAITLPLISFLVQTPVNDINLGVYSFTICKGLEPQASPPILIPTATSGRVFVEYVPSVILPANKIPVATGQLVQPLSEYYLLYDYVAFIAMWNTALSKAHYLIYDSPTPAPYFYYEPTTQLISLFMPLIYVSDNTTVCFNNQLLQYFLGLYTVNINQVGLDNVSGIDNVIINTANPSDGITSPFNGIKLSYQYNSYGYWNFLKTILITTTMNVNSEAVYNSNNSNSIALAQNVNYINILEDYIPDLAISNGAGIQNQIFTYNAQSLYKVFTFNQKTPLYKVNLAINIVDTYGNIYPLLLPKGQLANFKIMFIKKSIYASINKNLN